MSDKENLLFEGRNLEAAIAAAMEATDKTFDCLKLSLENSLEDCVTVKVEAVLDEPDPSLYQLERKRIDQKIAALIKAWDLDMTYTLTLSGHMFKVDLSGPDANMLLDNHGEVLSDLDYTFTRYKQSQFPKSVLEIHFDADDYRAGKQRELMAMVEAARGKVAEGNGSYKMSPMNPYERRLVHVALQDDPELETLSVGVGHFKSVLIRLRSENGPYEEMQDEEDEG